MVTIKDQLTSSSTITAPFIEFAKNDTVPENERRTIRDDLMVIEKSVDFRGVAHTLYILKKREDRFEEDARITCVDSVLLHYEGRKIVEQSIEDPNDSTKTITFPILDNAAFDTQTTPSWFSLINNIRGFAEGLPEFPARVEIKKDTLGNLTFINQPAVGALLIPSGLGYFNAPPNGSGINIYQNLLFTFQVLQTNKADSDNDGILDIDEDLDTDCVLLLDSGIQNAPPLADDDTDGDGVANFRDVDDDNDGVLTREEITFKADGTVDKVDFNGDGTPDYLDPRVREVRTEL